LAVFLSRVTSIGCLDFTALWQEVASFKPEIVEDDAVWSDEAWWAKASVDEETERILCLKLHELLDAQSAKIESQELKIGTMQEDLGMLSYDLAVTFAGQLLTRVLGDEECSAEEASSCPSAATVTNTADPCQLSSESIKFMSQHFTTNYTEQIALFQEWNHVWQAGNKAAQPQMLDEYNEGKALRLISMLERSANPTPLTKSILEILKARATFLTAAPCENMLCA